MKHLVVLVGNIPGSPTAVVQPSWARLLNGQLPIWALKVFDTFVSEPDVDNFPLEEIIVPTLMVHARDDSLASYRTVPPAAARIPGARLVTIERGGHLNLGSEANARSEVTTFLRARVPVTTS